MSFFGSDVVLWRRCRSLATMSFFGDDVVVQQSYRQRVFRQIKR